MSEASTTLGEQQAQLLGRYRGVRGGRDVMTYLSQVLQDSGPGDRLVEIALCREAQRSTRAHLKVRRVGGCFVL